jgi:hypothetical protein
MGHRTGQEDVEKVKILNLPGLELRQLSRPARSQSLYRPSYPQLVNIKICKVKLSLYLTK